MREEKTHDRFRTSALSLPTPRLPFLVSFLLPPTVPSGTGKTLSTKIITNELGIDLYKIDFSCIVSKYAAETEKNPANIFKEAETSNAIQFFDEADARFGKRDEIKDAYDRYANTEISYLLQKIEDYGGTLILASNFSKNID